jgi:hypothetical protein
MILNHWPVVPDANVCVSSNSDTAETSRPFAAKKTFT